jgi:hypothetical protein
MNTNSPSSGYERSEHPLDEAAQLTLHQMGNSKMATKKASGPTVATVKRLFAVSGNQCAFPKCRVPLVDPPSGKVTGRICHIKGRRPGSPRYDSQQTDTERHSFENLILMCPTHHDIIDADEESYTVERLQRIKATHEAAHPRVSEPTGNVVQQLLAAIEGNVVIDGSIIFTHNQMGGQVAHSIINVGPQPRHLSAEQRRAMLPFLEKLKGCPVAFACRMLDGESCDYATELATFFLQTGCKVPKPIETSLNDLPSYLALAAYGKPDMGILYLLENAFQAAGIPARIEAIRENSIGAWYQDVVHVIVGRNAS